MENNGNGNLFNLSIEEIEKGIIELRKDSAGTNVKVIKNQYLALAEYWEGVSEKMRH